MQPSSFFGTAYLRNDGKDSLLKSGGLPILRERSLPDSISPSISFTDSNERDFEIVLEIGLVFNDEHSKRSPPFGSCPLLVTHK